METLGYEKAEIKCVEKNLEALLKQVKKKIVEQREYFIGYFTESPYLVEAGRRI